MRNLGLSCLPLYFADALATLSQHLLGSGGAVQERALKQLAASQAPVGHQGDSTTATAAIVHTERSRIAWSGPYVVNGKVARPTAIPKIGLFYGIPVVALRARDKSANSRLSFHLSFADVQKMLLEGAGDHVLFSTLEIGKFMRARAQLAAEHGMFHDDEAADHNIWVARLAVVLTRAESQLSSASVGQGVLYKDVRTVWVNILRYIADFEDERHQQGWRWWDPSQEFQIRFSCLVSDICRSASSLAAGSSSKSASLPLATSHNDVLGRVLSKLQGANVLDSDSTSSKWVRDRSINWACGEEQRRKFARREGLHNQKEGFVQRRPGTPQGGHQGGQA